MHYLSELCGPSNNSMNRCAFAKNLRASGRDIAITISIYWVFTFPAGALWGTMLASLDRTTIEERGKAQQDCEKDGG
jgi:hypothetical protein